MPPSSIESSSFLVQHREHAEAAAERERADVAHEDLRGVRVVPKEADAGADHGAAVDRELARARDRAGCRDSRRGRSPTMVTPATIGEDAGTCRR